MSTQTNTTEILHGESTDFCSNFVTGNFVLRPAFVQVSVLLVLTDHKACDTYFTDAETEASLNKRLVQS